MSSDYTSSENIVSNTTKAWAMSENKIEKTRSRVEAGLAKRYRKEAAFKVFGMLATAVGIIFLAVFFITLIAEGASAFQQNYITIDVSGSGSDSGSGRVS